MLISLDFKMRILGLLHLNLGQRFEVERVNKIKLDKVKFTMSDGEVSKLCEMGP